MPIAFTTAQAPGAWPNGTRVVKTHSAAGDSHPDGALATVLGSLALGPLVTDFIYFVEWDDARGLPVMIVARRLREA